MNLKILLCMTAGAAIMTSCGHRPYKAEDLAVPVIHAVEDSDLGDLECMLPEEDNINEVFAGNLGALGGNYYNKYSRGYRRLSLETALQNDLKDIEYTVEKNKLSWNDVLMGAVMKEDVNEEGASYTRVSVPLRFREGGDYNLSYNTVQYKGIWYLLDDVSLLRSNP